MLFRRALSGTLCSVTDARNLRGERGQSSVELLGLLPVLVVLVALGVQAALAGQAWWLTRTAAHAAARAEAVGTPPRSAARGALPARLRHGVEVVVGDAGAVRVRVHLPSVIGVALGTVTAEAQMEPQR